MINGTTSTIEDIQVGLWSLAMVALNDKIALDIQLSDQGSVHAIANAINASGQVERSIKNIKKNAQMVFFSCLGTEPPGYV